MKEHKHKVYTAEDFERYYSGQMSEAEMHALEKSALEDPFLADALEGYSYTKTSLSDVAELRERLSKRNKGKQRFFLQNNVWLKVAASIIFFAGISYLGYELNCQKSFLAKNEGKEIVTTKDSPITTQKDIVKNNETPSSAKISELKNEQISDGKDAHAPQQDMKKIQVDSSKTT